MRRRGTRRSEKREVVGSVSKSKGTCAVYPGTNWMGLRGNITHRQKG